MRRNTKKRHMDEHEESWAVSYADLLMVLMSFFIVFFNIESGKGEKEHQDELVDIISKTFKKEERKYKVDLGGKKEGIRDLLELRKKLANANIKISAIGLDGATIRNENKEGLSSIFDLENKNILKKVKGLVVELPDDVFEVGEYELNNKIRNYLDNLVSKLSSYKEKLAVVAIGHADAIPMKAGKKVIQTNFILSSLRASKAVEYIITKGYDKHWVSGQAVSVENRATRSLSIRIYER